MHGPQRLALLPSSCLTYCAPHALHVLSHLRLAPVLASCAGAGTAMTGCKRMYLRMRTFDLATERCLVYLLQALAFLSLFDCLL